MKNDRLNRYPTLLLAVIILVSAGCAPQADQAPETTVSESSVFEITVEGLKFDAPEETRSGWTTFRLVNSPEMTHFALLQRLPEGRGIADQQTDVAPVFQEGMNLLAAGQIDSALAAFGGLPEWYANVVMVGGPGLVGPGITGETTVYLEEGRYLLECYVKTNGVFHSFNPSPTDYGMVHEFVVRDYNGSVKAPSASVSLAVSSDSGIVMSGTPIVGKNVVAIHFADQKVHENFVRHDVHLAQLSGAGDVDALNAWMDWSAPGGLETPAPATFLGGANEMPAGSTAYVTVTLEPGRYTWISEVPNPKAKGMLLEFEIDS